MIILAADASSKYCSAALLKDGEITCEIAINNGLVHSKTLMPMIEQVLSFSDVKVKDVDIFAAAVGPGSFTGVRIAVSTIKALAHAANKPCAAINTLEAAYYNIVDTNDALVCPILDARRAQVYTAVYQNRKEVLPPQALPLGELCEFLKQQESRCIFTGDGLPVHKEAIEKLMGAKAVFTEAPLMYQRAAAVAQLALRDYEKENLVTYQELSAFYLRKPQAEREYDERHKL